MLTATILVKQLFVPVAAWGLSLGTLTAPGGGGIEGVRSDCGGAEGVRAAEGGGVHGRRADLGLILVGNKDSRKPPPPPPPKKS